VLFKRTFAPTNLEAQKWRKLETLLGVEIRIVERKCKKAFYIS